MNPFQAIFTSYKRLKDKSVNVSFNLNEISSEDLLELDKSLDSFGILYYSKKDILTTKEKEAIDNVNLEIGGKSQSERLRNVMIVYAKQEGKDIAEFYKSETERFIEHYKSKLL